MDFATQEALRLWRQSQRDTAYHWKVLHELQEIRYGRRVDPVVYGVNFDVEKEIEARCDVIMGLIS